MSGQADPLADDPGAVQPANRIIRQGNLAVNDLRQELARGPAASIFKREAGVKDSGKFFPGIGGILDLLDSLLFNAPIMYLYLRHVLTRP